MAKLTREQVLAHLGEVDDLTVARIIGTGADERQLVEASQRVQRDATWGAPTPPATSPTVQELCTVLYELAAQDQALEEEG